MKKLVVAGMLLFAPLSYSEAKEAVFLFSSLSDEQYEDPIDKNATWRGATMTYQSIRNIGITPDDITILYNDAKPPREDTSIALRAELKDKIVLEGTYSQLEKIFREKTQGFSEDDLVILVTQTHGGDTGVLLVDYGNRISGYQLGELLSTTKARSISYYMACHSGSILPISIADNAVQVASVDKKHFSWLDRNYSSPADFFEAFSSEYADADDDGKISLEEAVEYARGKWKTYNEDFLDDYLRTAYIWSDGMNSLMIEQISCNPKLKRGRQVPMGWTLEKK